MIPHDILPPVVQVLLSVGVAGGTLGLTARWLPSLLREAGHLVIVAVALFHPSADRRAEAVNILSRQDPVKPSTEECGPT